MNVSLEITPSRCTPAAVTSELHARAVIVAGIEKDR